MTNINVIVAIEKNGGIGFNNSIPWKLSEDLKLFKKLTLNKCIVMGRKTYESIGKPLPKRVNIVLTKNVDLKYDNVIIANDVSEVLDIVRKNDKELFVCGGYSVYRSFLPLANKLYVTMVSADCKCDTYFMYNQTQLMDGCLDKFGFNKVEEIFNYNADHKNDYDFATILFERNDI